MCDDFRTQLIYFNKQLQLESEDTIAACASGNGEVTINFDKEAASNEGENQISTCQLNEYETLLKVTPHDGRSFHLIVHCALSFNFPSIKFCMHTDKSLLKPPV